MFSVVAEMLLATIFNWLYDSTVQNEMFARKMHWLYFVFRRKEKTFVAIFHQRKYCFAVICVRSVF